MSKRKEPWGQLYRCPHCGQVFDCAKLAVAYRCTHCQQLVSLAEAEVPEAKYKKALREWEQNQRD